MDGREALDFASNDYLGLAADSRLADAAADALRVHGTGAGAARLITGNHPLHEELEHELASLKGAGAALLFSSGYSANTGVIPALTDREDLIYSDELNHASLIDGCRLSRASVRVVAHCDPDALEELLKRDARRGGHRLVVVEGVFSMDGDRYPLRELLDVARRAGAWTLLDDAHATGVLGAHGEGSAAAAGLGPGSIDVTVGTLGKAFGCAGAFVTGSRVLIEYLRQRARTFVFTTGSPPALAAAALAALRIAREEPWRREHVAARAVALRALFARAGLEVGGAAESAIVPVVVGEPDRTMRAAAALLDAGFAVGAVRPPTVPEGTSRLRITLSASHSPDDIESLAAAVSKMLLETSSLNE
jgi:8-amino-7-oxononanoate synthase